MKPLLISSGEPAGIGPDICLSLVDCDVPLVILGNIELFHERARQLNQRIHFQSYVPYSTVTREPGVLWIWDHPLLGSVRPGVLDVVNAPYVLNLLDKGIQACLSCHFSALVTAPLHKGIINDAGVAFSGHTEYLATACGVEQVVMLLVSDMMKVALVTTHLPLSQVASAVTKARCAQVIEQVHEGLKSQFGISTPRILVAGLNPHAGEGGHLGHEEIEIITPVIQAFQAKGCHIEGPFPADTLFTHFYLKQADAIIAMYHDQGLPVLKHASFGEAVNMTLGLPFIRTSVDHGTALALAGTGKARGASLHAAVKLASTLAKVSNNHED